MDAVAAKFLKWFFFVGLLVAHALLAWNAFKFNWVFIEIATIWPAAAFSAAGFGLGSCYSIICMPGSVGWGLSLVVWMGTHYLIAVLLSSMLEERLGRDAG